jgi:YVTN family beta-propeller protein
VIHTGSLSVIRTYSGLGASPSAITAGPGETMLYIADEGGRSLIRLDLSNGRTTARELNITRGALVRSPDGRRIFTLNEKYVGEDLFDNVTRLDTATWLTTAIDRLPTVTVGDSPLAIAISAGGSRIYTAELTEPSGVSVIDSGTMTVTKRIPVNFLPVGIVVK